MEPNENTSFFMRFITPQEIPEAFLHVGMEQTLYAGESLQLTTLKQSGCFFILEGIIETLGIDFEGRDFTTFILDSGTMFLESDMLLGVTISTKGSVGIFKALMDTRLIFIEKTRFLALMETDAQVANLVANLLAQKMHCFRYLFYESDQHGVLWRLANLLFEFASKYGIEKSDRVKIDFPLNQEMMARMLHVNRVTVTKSITQLKDLELIEKANHHYYISNIEGLKKLLRKGF
jgi:CRP-like cAMP-binding protein